MERGGGWILKGPTPAPAPSPYRSPRTLELAPAHEPRPLGSTPALPTSLGNSGCPSSNLLSSPTWGPKISAESAAKEEVRGRWTGGAAGPGGRGQARQAGLAGLAEHPAGRRPRPARGRAQGGSRSPAGRAFPAPLGWFTWRPQPQSARRGPGWGIGGGCRQRVCLGRGVALGMEAPPGIEFISLVINSKLLYSENAVPLIEQAR